MRCGPKSNLEPLTPSRSSRYGFSRYRPGPESANGTSQKKRRKRARQLGKRLCHI
jgi:hypothetical protein